MSAPKSVVKIKADGIELIDSVDRSIYNMHELSRAALRDIARLIVKRFREKFYESYGHVTGRAGKATKYKVWASASTIYPRVEIGLKSAGQGGWAYFQEVGTKNVKKRQLLLQTVQENTGQIQQIAAAYLGQLGNDSTGGIEEGDVEG